MSTCQPRSGRQPLLKVVPPRESFDAASRAYRRTPASAMSHTSRTRGDEAPVNQPPERTASVGLNPFRQPGTCWIALIDGPTRLQAAGKRASVAFCHDAREGGLDGVSCPACQWRI